VRIFRFLDIIRDINWEEIFRKMQTENQNFDDWGPEQLWYVECRVSRIVKWRKDQKKHGLHSWIVEHSELLSKVVCGFHFFMQSIEYFHVLV